VSCICVRSPRFHRQPPGDAPATRLAAGSLLPGCVNAVQVTSVRPGPHAPPARRSRLARATTHAFERRPPPPLLPRTLLPLTPPRSRAPRAAVRRRGVHAAAGGAPAAAAACARNGRRVCAAAGVFVLRCACASQLLWIDAHVSGRRRRRCWPPRATRCACGVCTTAAAAAPAAAPAAVRRPRVCRRRRCAWTQPAAHTAWCAPPHTHTCILSGCAPSSHATPLSARHAAGGC
jgi:hypothetical protein